MAKKHGFHIIDLAKERIMCGSDLSTRNHYYSDGCHPNSEGYEKLGTIIAGKAMQMVN